MNNPRAPRDRTTALSPAPADPVSRIPSGGIRIGQWFRVHESGGEAPWLRCVTDVGRNYVELTGPGARLSHRTVRLGSDALNERLEPEPYPSAAICEMADKARGRMEYAMREIALFSTPPGGDPRLLEGSAREDLGAGVIRDLEGMPGGRIDDYRRALIRAREEELPALQKEIREAFDGETGQTSLTLRGSRIHLEVGEDILSDQANLIMEKREVTLIGVSPALPVKGMPVRRCAETCPGGRSAARASRTVRPVART